MLSNSKMASDALEDLRSRLRPQTIVNDNSIYILTFDSSHEEEIMSFLSWYVDNVKCDNLEEFHVTDDECSVIDYQTNLETLETHDTEILDKIYNFAQDNEFTFVYHAPIDQKIEDETYLDSEYDRSILLWCISKYHDAVMTVMYELKCRSIVVFERIIRFFKENDIDVNALITDEYVLMTIARDGNVAFINKLFELELMNKATFGHSSIFNYAFFYDNMILMEWIYQNRDEIDLKCTPSAVDNASQNGNITVLNWLWERKDQLQFKYTNESVDLACKYNHIGILDWWYDKYESGTELKYTAKGIDSASTRSRLDILNWWYNRKDTLELKYTEKAIDTVDYHIVIYNWWYDRRSELEFKYTDACIARICTTGWIDGLNWWYDRKNELNFRLPPDIIDAISSLGNSNILKFLFDHMDEFELKYTTKALDNVTTHFDVTCILNLWYESRHKTELKYTSLHLLNKNMSTWEWWYSHINDLEFKYTPEIVYNCIRKNEYWELKWWLDISASDNFDLKLDTNHIVDILAEGNLSANDVILMKQLLGY
jgi:hypothetical protein